MTQPVPDGPAGPPAPSCPRHPERPTRMSCQRCGRPTCPACAREAPVGIQCVDCVGAAARATPTTRSALGGVLTPGPPVLSYSLIGVCVVVYLAQLAVPRLTELGAFVPFVGLEQPWRFVTASFLHSPGQPMHIIFNMLALWQVGQWLEPMLGRARFGALYLLSGFGGTVAYLLFARPPSSVLDLGDGAWFSGMIGASGAVFGLFGAALVSLRRLDQPLGGMLVLLGINAVIPVFAPAIAWQAHLGGFVVGALVTLIVAGLAAPGRRRWQWPALAAVAVILLALVAVAYSLADTSFVDNLPTS
ncbi:rhomboid family intramembrane serine protease [Agilicoccus flavus]|uniref:rhomboid family intramembrane serine protease n=1 Tax=Agilicoccus flavus TaxID=2775968 RepID=UPI001CF6AD67|nr:rhomboid family intramembrane serine protease [Agilicoccus flavus]